MRILIACGRYLPHRGGLETAVAHLAREWRSMGHAVMIVTNRYPRRLPAREVVDGIEVHRLQFLYPRWRYLRQGRPELFFGGLLFSWWSAVQLWGIVRRFRPDIISQHYLGGYTRTLLWLQRVRRVPWVISLHGGDVDGAPQHDPAARRLLRRAVEHADAVTACSRYLADQAAALCPALQGRVQVVHNGVDVERFAQARPYRHARPYIAAVGQLVPHKGFDMLIRAFAAVAREREVDLLIAGDGPERGRLERLAAGEQIQHQVHLLGNLDESDVAGLMKGSLFVAMPSLRESFGLVALEAMAAGRRVMATRVGGLPEFADTEDNVLLPATEDAWSEALGRWLKADGHASPANVAAAREHRWELVARHYLEILELARRRIPTNKPSSGGKLQL